MTEYAFLFFPVLSFTCFGWDLLAEEHSCMCVLGFITEVLGTDLGPAATKWEVL